MFFKYGKYLLYVKDHPLKVNPRKIDPNVVKIESSCQIKQIVLEDLGYSESILEYFLSNGATIFYYVENHRPLGIMFGYRGSCYIRGPGISLVQNENSVYWFWIYTLPQARKKYVFSKLKNAFFLFHQGASGFSALVDPNNNVMLSQLNKLGFKAQKLISYFKFQNISILCIFEIQTKKTEYKVEFGNKNAFFLI